MFLSKIGLCSGFDPFVFETENVSGDDPATSNGEVFDRETLTVFAPSNDSLTFSSFLETLSVFCSGYETETFS